MSTTNDAIALRGVIDDLCEQIKRSGTNETGLPPVYAEREIGDKRKLADELIYSLQGAATSAYEDAREARADAEDYREQLNEALEEVKKLRATGTFPTPTASGQQIAATT